MKVLSIRTLQARFQVGLLVFGLLCLLSLAVPAVSLFPSETQALEDLRAACPELQHVWTGSTSQACSWLGLECTEDDHPSKLYVSGLNIGS